MHFGHIETGSCGHVVTVGGGVFSGGVAAVLLVSWSDVESVVVVGLGVLHEVVSGCWGRAVVEQGVCMYVCMYVQSSLSYPVV